MLFENKNIQTRRGIDYSLCYECITNFSPVQRHKPVEEGRETHASTISPLDSVQPYTELKRKQNKRQINKRIRQRGNQKISFRFLYM